jgi:hypothetical protein
MKREIQSIRYYCAEDLDTSGVNETRGATVKTQPRKQIGAQTALIAPLICRIRVVGGVSNLIAHAT